MSSWWSSIEMVHSGEDMGDGGTDDGVPAPSGAGASLAASSTTLLSGAQAMRTAGPAFVTSDTDTEDASAAMLKRAAERPARRGG